MFAHKFFKAKVGDLIVSCSECDFIYKINSEDTDQGHDLNHCECCGSLLEEGDIDYVSDN